MNWCESKAEQENFGLELGKLLGFDNLVELGWNDTETSIGIAYNKTGVMTSEGPVPSDRRLKTDVRPAGKTADGLSLYDFSFSGIDGTFRGVIAQDLLADARHANAVETRKGYYVVDYGKLGLRHLVSPEMRAAGRQAFIAAAGPL